MKHLFLLMITFIIFVSEGVAIDLLPNALTTSETMIVPHWVLVFLILVNIFFDTNETYFSIVYGVIFGLLIDIVYAGVLGVYMFSYPFSLYMTHLLKRLLHTNLLVTSVIMIISISITELLIFFIYSIIALIDVTLSGFFYHRLLPTVLANVIFLIPSYFIFGRILTKWGKEQFEQLHT